MRSSLRESYLPPILSVQGSSAQKVAEVEVLMEKERKKEANEENTSMQGFLGKLLPWCNLKFQDIV